MSEVHINIVADGLDAALTKAAELVATLEKAKSLADEVASLMSKVELQVER